MSKKISPNVIKEIVETKLNKQLNKISETTNIISSSRDKIQDFIQSSKNSYIIILFLFLIVFLIIYISKKLRKNNINCENINQVFENEYTKNAHNGFFSFDDLDTKNYFQGNINNRPYYYKLNDFYIKTAYNCFCNGRFRNDYVNKCALINCAKNGVRALDMQLYSLNDVPIVGASSVNTNAYKEMYNNIKFDNALQLIDNVYFQSGYFDDKQQIQNNLKNDPLFLILRLHYGNDNKLPSSYSSKEKNQLMFYNKIYKSLIEQFPENKFASKFMENQTNENLDKRRQIMNIKMKDTKNLIFVFIILNDEPNYNIVKKSNLNSLVSLYGDDLVQFRYNEVNIGQGTNVVSTFETQNNLCYCMPTLSTYNDNYDFTIPMKYGTQFIGMNFQKMDKYLKEYNNFFKNSIEDNCEMNSQSNCLTSPYVKKPDHMIRFGILTYS